MFGKRSIIKTQSERNKDFSFICINEAVIVCDGEGTELLRKALNSPDHLHSISYMFEISFHCRVSGLIREAKSLK